MHAQCKIGFTCVAAGQSVEVKVETADYLRILEGAYFIRFTAVALSSDKQAAVLDTTLLRLKVCEAIHVQVHAPYT